MSDETQLPSYVTLADVDEALDECETVYELSEQLRCSRLAAKRAAGRLGRLDELKKPVDIVRELRA